jgi:DAACS family dicarboxylate/amino acid:cation (Na+ or H+) symporter
MTETRRGIPLHTQMLIGFAIGLTAGLIVHATAGPDAAWVEALTTYVTQPIGQIFLRLLFMLVIPLLFSALVVGVSEMGDIASLGRAGWRTLALTVLLSSAAVVLGLVLVNVLRPGDGVDPATVQRMLAGGSEGARSLLESAPPALEGPQAIVELIPSNIFTAASENQILPVMVFALLFGIGLVLTKTPSAERVREVLDGVFHIAMTLINIVIRFAPIAIACLIFNLAALFGWELLQRLGAYVGVVVLALAIHLFVVYPIALRLLGGMSPVRFFRDVQEAMLVAFSTASSNATLPTACASRRPSSTSPAGSAASSSPSAPPPTRTAPPSSKVSPSSSSPSSSAWSWAWGSRSPSCWSASSPGSAPPASPPAPSPWWPSSWAWSACRPKPSA